MLRYIGPRLSTGEPERYLDTHAIPAGDVDESTLTEDQIAAALASGLYERETKPAKSGAKES